MESQKYIEQNQKDEEKQRWERKYGKICYTCKFPGNKEESMRSFNDNGEYERECRFCALNRSLKFRWKASDTYIKNWAKVMDDIKEDALNGVETGNKEFYEHILKLLGGPES